MAMWSLRDPLVQRVSWGALFAGFFFGFAAWAVLLALGAGVGLAAFNPRDVGNWQGLGVGVGIWGIIAGIIAMFLAGWLAARLSATDAKASGVLHGVAVWGFMIVAGLWIASTAIGQTASTAAQVAGGAAQAAGQAAGQAAANPNVQQQAREQANRLQQQARGAEAQVQQNAGQLSEKAASAGTAGAWVFFVYGILTLAAAALGGGVAVPRDRRLITPREQQAPAPGGPYAPQRA